MPDDNPSPDAPPSPFAALLKEIGDCPQTEAKQHLAEWRQRLDAMWPADTSNGDNWKLLVKQLPLAANAPDDVDAKKFPALLSATPEASRSLDEFLCDCGYTRLHLHYWSKHDGDLSYRFVAGCVNLAVLARKFDLATPNDTFVAELQNLLKRYCESVFHRRLQPVTPVCDRCCTDRMGA